MLAFVSLCEAFHCRLHSSNCTANVRGQADRWTPRQNSQYTQLFHDFLHITHNKKLLSIFRFSNVRNFKLAGPWQFARNGSCTGSNQVRIFGPREGLVQKGNPLQQAAQVASLPCFMNVSILWVADLWWQACRCAFVSRARQSKQGMPGTFNQSTNFLFQTSESKTKTNCQSFLVTKDALAGSGKACLKTKEQTMQGRNQWTTCFGSEFVDVNNFGSPLHVLVFKTLVLEMMQRHLSVSFQISGVHSLERKCLRNSQTPTYCQCLRRQTCRWADLALLSLRNSNRVPSKKGKNLLKDIRRNERGLSRNQGTAEPSYQRKTILWANRGCLRFGAFTYARKPTTPKHAKHARKYPENIQRPQGGISQNLGQTSHLLIVLLQPYH